MSENLRERYTEVMDKHRPVQSSRLVVDCLCGWMADKRRSNHFAEHLMDELLAVRDDVLAEKDAEIERLRNEGHERGWYCVHCRLWAAPYDLATSLGNVLPYRPCSTCDGVQLPYMRADVRAVDALARAEAAEAEVARLREENAGLRETLDEVIHQCSDVADIFGGYLCTCGQGSFSAKYGCMAPRPSASEAPRARDGEPTPRLRACVEAWPDCSEGEYNPACCRFPKSCSCTVYDSERVTAADLETRDDERDFDGPLPRMSERKVVARFKIDGEQGGER